MNTMKKTNTKGPAHPSGNSAAFGWALPLVLGIVYCLAVCLCGISSAKGMATLLLISALGAVFLCFSVLRRRMSLPLLALTLVVLMGVVSTFYAVSGKFALYESLKLVSALCLTLLLLAFSQGRDPARSMATVLASAAALMGLLSIDLLSTRFLSGLVLGLLGAFTPDYQNLAGVEAGVRMLSIFDNANIFAGVAGLGVLLSLHLALSAKSPWEKRAQLCVLYVNALAFLLAFSMGASGSIALAFLVYLLLERPSQRSAALVLMVQTLVLTVLSAALISQTSFQTWETPRPIPLLCTVAGAVLLCLSERYVGRPLGDKLKGKAVLWVSALLVALLAVFAVVAYHWTGPVDLSAGEQLRRAVYPQPGAYTLEVPQVPVDVTIESQDQRETMMHTSTVLYSGPLDQAAFTVPEDSLVVYFDLTARDPAQLTHVTLKGAEASYGLPLSYPLLPSFIANRLQGLWANENAIQRLVFFSDGLKLFRRSPVVGLGLGAFENGIRSVQSFDYQTKYAHNHYIQTLAETGVMGLGLLLLLLGTCAVAVLWTRKKLGEDCPPMVPALGAALVFIAAHATTEVVLSSYAYLPIAFGVFALIGFTTQESFTPKWFGKTPQLATLVVLCVLLVGYGVQLARNTMARSIIERNATMDTLVEAAQLDPFEWADYMLSYVDNAVAGETVDVDVLERADGYAQRLAQVSSNTIPIHLAEYYFRTDRPDQGLAMAEKYLDYVSSNPEAWSLTFRVLEHYYDGSQLFYDGVQRIAAMLEDWNRENLGSITLDEQAQSFLDGLSAPAEE